MVAKKIVQDIVPNEHRSIRKISIEREEESTPKISRRKIVREEEIEEIEEMPEVETPTAKKSKTRRKTSSKYIITFIIILLSIIVIGVALSLSYSKAVVTITPKITNFNIDGTFTAKKGALGEDLNYEVITVSDSASQSIDAVKGPVIQTKAKGTAIIYNNYSASPQTLVAGTRLTNSDGLVYRTTSTVSVPGKKTAPGSISVTIVADQAGENYNVKVSDLKGDFKLPGYQGSPKYSGFYARLKTDVTGGFSGNKMTINTETQKAAIISIQSALKEKLITKLKQSVSKDHILYDGAYTVDYEVPEPVMKSATTAEITVKGVAYGSIFQNGALIKFIAGKEIKKFPSESYLITGDTALNFKISNSKDFSPKKGTPLIFTLKGPVTITGTFSEEKLKNELKGIKLEQSNAVFAKYPAIANAYALITPFWLRSFPNSTDKINVEYKH